jgi:hypothetical protein
MARRKGKNPATETVGKNDVFVTFVTQAASLGNEVTARRKFDDEVTTFLTVKGLTEEFETWRANRTVR